MSDNFFNKKLETLSLSEIQNLQKKRLRRTLRFAYENSPFYANVLRNAGLDPAEIRSIEQLQKAKFFTTKEDLRENYPYGMLAIPRERIAEMHATSGTTGTPTLGFHSEFDLQSWAEISARSLTMAKLTKEDVFQITPSIGMFSGGFGFYHGARKIGCAIVPASAGFSKRQIQFMVDFKTSMFSAIVSYAFRLAEVAKEMGIDPAKGTRVRKGIFGSEIWTKETKKRIAQIWDLEPYDVYGFTELYGPGMGNDCRIHDGIHIWQDFFLVEVVNSRTGEPVGVEEEGELVFTTLTKEAMPLIRYRSRDISKMLDSPSCECGRTHRRYSEIKGRTDDMIKVSGISFWPSQVETILLRNLELGPEYRIQISKANSIDRMSIVVESKDKIGDETTRMRMSEKLAFDLHEALLFTPNVTIVDPNSFPRIEGGKTKRVFDER